MVCVPLYRDHHQRWDEYAYLLQAVCSRESQARHAPSQTDVRLITETSISTHLPSSVLLNNSVTHKVPVVMIKATPKHQNALALISKIEIDQNQFSNKQLPEVIQVLQ